jgi:signal transduction histidine kinase
MNIFARMARSLSAQLLVIFVLASFAYSYAVRNAVEVFNDTDWLRQIVGAHIALHTEYVLGDIGVPPNIERAMEIVAQIPIDIRIVGPDQDWVSDPDFPDLGALPFGPMGLLELSDASLNEVEAWARTLELVEFARHEEHVFVKMAQGDYLIVFASPRIRETRPPTYTTLIFSVVGLTMLLLMYLAVRWLFRPIKWMQEGTARIGRGELDYRIPKTRRGELGDLTQDINRMADDVQGMLEAKRQLMLAISHELRSPLTRAKVALELLDDVAVRQNILEDIDDMERLIADLLESEALNTRHAILRLESVDLGELVESVINTDFAEQRNRVELLLPEARLEGQLDASRMRLLVRNLVENALRYSSPGGEKLQIRGSRSGDYFELRVTDHGEGIPAEHLARVTEPFYRADPARSRATGGIGLGLYLCRLIAEAHGGLLHIESEPGRGTVVTITLSALTVAGDSAPAPDHP